MSFLILSHLRVRGATSVNSSWFAAPPGPLPYLGLTHRLSREVASLGPVYGVAVVHHDFEFRAESPNGYRPNFHQYRAASFIDEKDYARTNKYALSLQPAARCDVEVSLILELDEDTRVDVEATRDALGGMPLAGGRIEPLQSTGDVVYQSDDDALLARRSVGTGHVMVERSDLMEQTRPNQDRLDRMLEWLNPSRDRSEEPWLLPAALGYRAITDIKTRAGSREGYRHAFAETLVGLVQYQKDWSAEPAFWHYERPASDLFIATTQQLPD